MARSEHAANSALAGTKQAYLFGLFADEAVLKAARELRRLGLAVTVATDALCARSQEPEALARAIADMVADGTFRKINEKYFPFALN